MEASSFIFLLLFGFGVVTAQSEPPTPSSKNSTTANSAVLSLYPSHSSAAMKATPKKVVSKHFYTIQVYASCTRNFAEAFVRHLPDAQKFSIIKVKQGVCSTYKVIYGKYSSYKKACRALQNTHGKLARYKPWVTKIGSDIAPVVTVSKLDKAKKHTRKAAIKKKVSMMPIAKLIKKKPVHVTPAKYSFRVYNGSLKHNITRFSKRFHYKLIWNVVDANAQSADFSWVGSKTMKSESPESLLQNIMSAYPVQVIVWQANKVICITSNNSCVMRGTHV